MRPQEPINKLLSKQTKSPYDDMIDELVEEIMFRRDIEKSLDSHFPTKQHTTGTQQLDMVDQNRFRESLELQEDFYA